MKETLFLTIPQGGTYEWLTPSSRFAGLRSTGRYRCAGNLNFGEVVGGVLYPDWTRAVSLMSGYETPPTFSPWEVGQ